MAENSPSYTGQTDGYFAAYQANDVFLAYAKETKYGVVATGSYQRARLTGESFRPQTQTARPDEINDLAEAAQSVITQISVSGTLSGALSYGTYDDLLASVLCADWQTDALQNNKIVKTWTIIEKMGEKYFVRPGSFCTKAELGFSQGNFATVSFDFTSSRQELADSAPGTVVAETQSKILNTLGNFGDVVFGSEKFSGATKEVQITIERNGSASDYAIGTAQAVGIRPGETLVSGQIQIYFKSWELYQKYSSQWSGPIVISVSDDEGQGYKMTFLNASLTNPVINAGQKNSSIVATFDIEASPQSGGGTFKIERIKKTKPTEPPASQTSGGSSDKLTTDTNTGN